jgi:hypothetical protein
MSSSRILTGMVFHCIACDRTLAGSETTRTYPHSPELVALCNTCLHKSKDHSYQYEFEHQAFTESTSISNLPSYDENL